MVRRTVFLAAIAALLLSSVGASAEPEDRLPVYEPAVVEVVPGGECAAESQFDSPDRYHVDATGQLVDPSAPGARAVCERLRIVFGPIIAKPGQNDVLIQPVTFEKPMYDGYLVRFKPNLVSYDGTPPVEDLHLHHGTWLNAGRSYGSGPWIASGEEKTIATWPTGFGLKILGNDTWLFLHMVHNATPVARPVFVTYDMDFVKATDAEVVQADAKPLLRNTKGIWLDVGGSKFHPDTQTYPYNPVFNAQRGEGSVSAESGLLECAFPAQNCAMFNSLGNVSAQQGNDVSNDPLGSDWAAPNVLGKDWKIPYGFLGGTKEAPGVGTLVVMGGHVHNGGLRDEVELVRDLDGDGKYEADEERLIHISEAYYWDYEDPTRIGAPPVSWDFSMTGAIADHGWKINVREGDVLRLNGVYDTTLGSWYEQMGIVMTWVAPGETFGYDMFAKDGNGDYVVSIDTGLPTTLNAVPNGPDGAPLPQTCNPVLNQTLCVKGQVTHGHSSASGNHATCPPTGCLPVPGANVDGPLMDEIHIGGFTFGPADMGITGLTGVPTVTKGEPVRFVNWDTAGYMWHTITRCALPCTGGTSASYPIADGGWTDLHAPEQLTPAKLLELGPDPMDFDSSELGIGLAPSGRIDWTFTPTRTGLYAFFCRIHPQMRGAIKVVE